MYASVDLLNPQWVIIENVPRLLSINDGRDMAKVLQTLAKSGYGWSYRVLNSRYFGVAQGRKRIFIVGCFGKQCPPEILFHAEGDQWDVSKDAETSSLGKSVATRNRHDASVETFIAEPQSHCLQAQTGRRANAGWDTYIAKTVGCGGRGYNGFMWQENYIAEFNTDGKRDLARISAGLDTARGQVIGNAVTVPVIEWIGKRIVKYTESQNNEITRQQ